MLDGEFTFYTGDPDTTVHRLTAAAGEVVPLAGGTPHTIRNESGFGRGGFRRVRRGRMEHFTRAAAALAVDGAPPRWRRSWPWPSRNGIDMLGPIPVSAARVSKKTIVGCLRAHKRVQGEEAWRSWRRMRP